MKLSSLKRIVQEDLRNEKDVDGKFDKVLTAVNQFMDEVVTALRNKLTFADNFYGKRVSIELTHNVEKEINPGVSLGSVDGISLIDSNSNWIKGFRYRRLTNGSLGLTVEYDSSSITNNSCVFYIFYK